MDQRIVTVRRQLLTARCCGQAIAARLTVVIALLATLAASQTDAIAQEDRLPAWRRGAPLWNGTGYETPVEATMPVRTDLMPPTHATASGPGMEFPTPPYTVPTDPGISLSSPVNGEPTDLLPQQPLTDQKNFNVNPSAGNASTAGNPTGGVIPNDGSIEPLPPPSSGEENNPPADASGVGDGDVAEAIDQRLSESSEPLPLQEQVTQWYQYTRQWMQGWDSHAEFGLDGSNGNADTLAIQTGLELQRKTDRWILNIDTDYRQASSRNRTVEDNGRLNVDYDYIFNQSHWSGFGKFGLEWDEFKAFDLRVNTNGGLGYYWIREDDHSLVTRFGAGASREIGAPDDDWIPEAVFGIDGVHQINSRQKIRGRVDYFPAWEDFRDFRPVTDLSWETLLDDSDNLRLKLAATDRYDSTPQGAEPNDLYYSLLLLYKF